MIDSKCIHSFFIDSALLNILCRMWSLVWIVRLSQVFPQITSFAVQPTEKHVIARQFYDEGKMDGFYKGLSLPLMNNIFKLRAENPNNLRQVSEFSRPMVKSVYDGIESISYLRINSYLEARAF